MIFHGEMVELGVNHRCQSSSPRIDMLLTQLASVLPFGVRSAQPTTKVLVAPSTRDAFSLEQQ